jgi:N-acetylmuramoyl-L-alanine amidase
VRPLRACLAIVVCVLALSWPAGPAGASVAHTVAPGETLWSIAAANNFTTRALAAANGLPETAQIVTGATIQIPSEAEAARALGAAAGVPASGAPPASAGAAAPEPLGAYTVRPGDTLSGIAARSGIPTGQLAWMNGVDPAALLLSGTVLKLPTGAPAPPPALAEQPQIVPDAPPHPTPGHVTPAQVGEIASAHGLSPSLAAAVAMQESGFDNGAVSSANARGVMQILPGTWSFIQDRLAERPLDPSAPVENVHAGVMYLEQLVRDTGGDEAAAVASYYQGLSSVRNRGLLPDTERYVQNVMALRGRFGPS